MKKDVTIIGAGLTGLTLAFYLQRAGKNVLLVEKEDRVGGVINTDQNRILYMKPDPIRVFWQILK